MILTKLKRYALRLCGDRVAADVRIGLGYCAVALDDTATGVAYTLRDNVPHGCTVFNRCPPLAGRRVSELVEYIDSADVLERAVGIAAANALINREVLVDMHQGDVLDHLDLRPDDAVGMIGCFAPLIEALANRVRTLHVFDMRANAAGGVYGEEAIEHLLPECSVALVTATTLINATFEEVMRQAGHCRIRVVLGPSTPLAPDVFKDCGCTMLSGICCLRPEAILQAVSEGGGMRDFRPHVRKVTVLINDDAQPVRDVLM